MRRHTGGAPAKPGADASREPTGRSAKRRGFGGKRVGRGREKREPCTKAEVDRD